MDGKSVDRDRLFACYQAARTSLLGERNSAGHWVGKLSTSPLSTATAVVALWLVDRAHSDGASSTSLGPLVTGGLRFLAEHQNDDGGWGDTLKSLSNISTTMLVHAAFQGTGATRHYQQVVDRADSYLQATGGIAAVRERYGKDHTFSVPILTHSALCGQVDWREVAPLPFELACLPHAFFKWLQLPVVSYALPALIAIGQARHFHQKPGNPVARLVRALARAPSLKVLTRIQPSSGGFLEATPLTSFVTMSLASMGLVEHPVVQRAVDFLIRSVRADGSWPIDTNLSTWVTTLSVNALGSDMPPEARAPLRDWLLGQQYRQVHPYTKAAPGGWAWTDLPGGVPDADDTPGALLALRQLEPASERATATVEAARRGIGWLLAVQNGDGGWPTFCRGWGYLPFDRSSPDLTAHALRALVAWGDEQFLPKRLQARMTKAIKRGCRYLECAQRPDGSWLPLWFGNQYRTNDENPTYGTARVLTAWRDLGRLQTSAAQRGFDWLVAEQNAQGGWGDGADGRIASVEETALAVEALLDDPRRPAAVFRGLDWLMARVEAGTAEETAPIGFYFAKLWYYEELYPKIFVVGALARACRGCHNGVNHQQACGSSADMTAC